MDNSSNLISFKNNFEKLPNIFGEGAEEHFMFFFEQLKSNNFPNEKIKNFYYFQIGRWDLQLINGKIIKYPSNNTEVAIKKSIKLLKRKDFENYNIIDLRIEGKIGIIELGNLNIKCLIFKVKENNDTEILSTCIASSEGIHNGSVVNLARASRAIRSCIGNAEKKANTTLKKINVVFEQPEFLCTKF